MASATKLVHVLVILLFCLLLVQQISENNCGHGCFYAEAAAPEVQNRKVLYDHGLNVVFKSSSQVVVHGSPPNINDDGRYGEGMVEGNWELRKVPSGPDPLHHNGGSPKKPRTP